MEASCTACVDSMDKCEFCGAPDAGPVLFYGLSPHGSDGGEGFKTHLLCKSCEEKRQIYCPECKEPTEQYVEGTMMCPKCAAKDYAVQNCNGCGLPFAPASRHGTSFCISCVRKLRKGQCVECGNVAARIDNTGRCDDCQDIEIG